MPDDKKLVDTKLTAIAKSLRSLSSRKDTLTLDEMAEVADEANDEAGVLLALTSEAKSILESKEVSK
jgi:hypothetical protein